MEELIMIYHGSNLLLSVEFIVVGEDEDGDDDEEEEEDVEKE